MNTLKPNLPLLVETYNHIVANPKEWNQAEFHCGTSHCFYGWAYLLANKLSNDPDNKYGSDSSNIDLFNAGNKLLGLDYEQGKYLVNAERTLIEIQEFILMLIRLDKAEWSNWIPAPIDLKLEYVE